VNPQMKWIETVIRADRHAVKKHYPELSDDVDSGQFAVSMGMFAKADVCPVCNNVRRSVKDKICKHIQPPILGTIYPDGSVAGMINLHPAFHDISIVRRGADSIGWSLKKVAEAPAEVIRQALTKLKKEKLIDKVKAVPKQETGKPLEKLSKVMLDLAKKEPDIKPEVLLSGAKKYGSAFVPGLLDAGTLLRPQEFQSAYLGCQDPDRAKTLAKKRIVFKVVIPELSSLPPLHMEEVRVDGLPQDLKVWIGNRISPWKSWYKTSLMHRMMNEMPAPDDMFEMGQSWKQQEIPDLKDIYIRYLLMAIKRLSGKETKTPNFFTSSHDPEVHEIPKEGSWAAMSILLPSLYFAYLMGKDISSGKAPSFNSKDKTFLQKLVLLDPNTARSLTQLAGVGVNHGMQTLDKMLKAKKVFGK